MDEILKLFEFYDVKSREVFLDMIIESYEIFFVALQYATIPEYITSKLYSPEEIVQQCTKNPSDISNILKYCDSEDFLRQLSILQTYQHPIVNSFRFVKTRDLNCLQNQHDYYKFPFPKHRVWLFFKYKMLFCVVKQRDVETKPYIIKYFQRELSCKLENGLYVLEVCYDTKKSDVISNYNFIDVMCFNNESFVTKNFKERYTYLQNLDEFPVLAHKKTPEKDTKYLLKKLGDNCCNRTEWVLNLKRLEINTYLLIGEVKNVNNNRLKIFVAQFDSEKQKFNVIGSIGKSNDLESYIQQNKIECVPSGFCVFGKTYEWKCVEQTGVLYYNQPITAKIMILSKRINMRSQIKHLIYPPLKDSRDYLS